MSVGEEWKSFSEGQSENTLLSSVSLKDVYIHLYLYLYFYWFICLFFSESENYGEEGHRWPKLRARPFVSLPHGRQGTEHLCHFHSLIKVIGSELHLNWSIQDSNRCPNRMLVLQIMALPDVPQCQALVATLFDNHSVLYTSPRNKVTVRQSQSWNVALQSHSSGTLDYEKRPSSQRCSTTQKESYKR